MGVMNSGAANPGCRRLSAGAWRVRGNAPGTKEPPEKAAAGKIARPTSARGSVRSSILSRDRGTPLGSGSVAPSLVALSISIAALLAAASPPADDWPQFRGNAQLTGVA